MSFFKYFLTAIAYLVIHASFAQTQAEFNLVGPPENLGPTHDLWATYYYVYKAASAPDGLPFRDKSGTVLSDNVQPQDWCMAAIEGTVQVFFHNLPRTLNYAGKGAKSQVDCAAVLKINPINKPWITSTGKSFFVSASGAFGDGVKGVRLVPYRTIAVDRTVLPYGTVLFIPRAQGVEVHIPDGSSIKHDGYFYAGDTGGAIRGPHIDIFCGSTTNNCFPSFIGSSTGTTFKAIVVKDKTIIEILASQHKVTGRHRLGVSGIQQRHR